MTDTLDLTNLNEAYDGDREGIAELLDEACGFFAKSQTEMHAALASGDASALAKAAHAVKGAAGNIGAAAVYTISAKIEDAAKAGRLAEPASTIGEFDVALGELNRAISTYKGA